MKTRFRKELTLKSRMSRPQKILAIETSCDDTSAAVVDTKYNILSNIISSQGIHEKFGGVVPELASREHIKGILPVVDAALNRAVCSLEHIDAIAVAVNPGLIGSLLVGVSFAKGLAASLDKPLIAVNHILGHVFVNFIEYCDIKFPFISLIVSGGHTELVRFDSINEFEVLGRTVDDAAGEAFDKIGKLLGFKYPGGPHIDAYAKKGDKNKIDFPRPMLHQNNYDFSFSGLKTAASLYLKEHKINKDSDEIYDFCSSFQNAIVDVLFQKTIKTIKDSSLKNLLLAGGVAANSQLRNRFERYSKKDKIKLYIPSIKLCTDNAVMIGAAAIQKLKKKKFTSMKINPSPTKGIRSL